MIAIINSGIGNIGSVRRALAELGADSVVADSPEVLETADRVILPGVGSFADGMSVMRENGWVEPLRKAVVEHGTPLLGICLGMHLLAESGTEGGDIPGLGLIPGRIVRLDAIGCGERIPHVGWNDVRLCQPGHPLFAGIPSRTDFYFVHSYAYAETTAEDVIGEIDYGVPVTAVVGRGNVYGTQFHPEKSSKAGIRLLRNFLDADSC
jgi:imidazole glycerol-phosphate synthase subunit HisH